MNSGKSISPLAGIRILDFSHILAGPYCTRLLADLGADVVKVETKSRPDLTGALRPGEKVTGRTDRSPLYLNTNRSKRSITLNLKSAAAREMAVKLAGRADVIVENFSANVMTRLGLDYEPLSLSNPGLIYLSLSGYGHTGPRKHWTSMNMNLQAHSGLMFATGEEGDPPVAISNSWNDYIGGIHGCFAVLEALADRRRTGKGALLDISQFECSVATIGGLLMAGSVNGQPGARPGNRCSAQFPQGVYRCAGEDDWCALIVENDDQWVALVGLIGDRRLDDARYATLDGRIDASAEIDAAIGAWLRTLESREAERRLTGAGIPATRMHRIGDVMELPAAATAFPLMEDPSDRERRVSGLPIDWKGLASALRPAPRLGEHTDAVLAEWLGAEAGDTEEYRRQGAFE